jgi:hypothetical protein
MLDGSCHCGAIAIEFETARAPGELPIRHCGCRFCARHHPSYTSDPTGHVAIRIASEHSVARYRFGLGLADFLICGTCGVFVAAFEPGPSSPGSGRAVVNLRVLERASEFTAEPTRFTAYDAEDAATRTARRARSWTPATLAIAR